MRNNDTMAKKDGHVNDFKFSLPDQVWAGTEHSLLIALEAHNAMMAGIFTTEPATPKAEEERSYLLTQDEGVGIVSIRGSLTNRDSWMNEFMGMTSYPEIRRALTQAATDPSITHILLDIDSGGGAVAGVADVTNLLQQVSAVKPVYAFTDGTMASAAYWIGSTAERVFASRTAMLGSIGVIATHMEMSRRLEKEGIGVNVVRAGEHKALLNRFEPATPKALAGLQAQLDQVYDVFIEHVAEARGTTVAIADKQMGQGREFVGEAAVNAGLADAITTFDKVVGWVQAKNLDT